MTGKLEGRRRKPGEQEVFAAMTSEDVIATRWRWISPVNIRESQRELIIHGRFLSTGSATSLLEPRGREKEGPYLRAGKKIRERDLLLNTAYTERKYSDYNNRA